MTTPENQPPPENPSELPTPSLSEPEASPTPKQSEKPAPTSSTPSRTCKPIDRTPPAYDWVNSARSLLRRGLKGMGKEKKTGHDVLLEQMLASDTLATQDCALVYTISLIDINGEVFTVKGMQTLAEIKNRPADSCGTFEHMFWNMVFRPVFSKFVQFMQQYILNGNLPLDSRTQLSDGASSVERTATYEQTGYGSDRPDSEVKRLNG